MEMSERQIRLLTVPLVSDSFPLWISELTRSRLKEGIRERLYILFSPHHLKGRFCVYCIGCRTTYAVRHHTAHLLTAVSHHLMMPVMLHTGVEGISGRQPCLDSGSFLQHFAPTPECFLHLSAVRGASDLGASIDQGPLATRRASMAIVVQASCLDGLGQNLVSRSCTPRSRWETYDIKHRDQHQQPH